MQPVPNQQCLHSKGCQSLAPLNWLTWHHLHSDSESHQNFHSLFILEYSKDKNHVSIVLFGTMILESKCTFNGLTRVPMARWAALGSGIPMGRGSSQHHDDLMRFCFQAGSTYPQQAVSGSIGLENGMMTLVARSSPILSPISIFSLLTILSKVVIPIQVYDSLGLVEKSCFSLW